MASMTVDGQRGLAMENETGFGGPKFDPPLYKQRYNTIVALARRLQAKKVCRMM